MQTVWYQQNADLGEITQEHLDAAIWLALRTTVHEHEQEYPIRETQVCCDAHEKLETSPFQDLKNRPDFRAKCVQFLVEMTLFPCENFKSFMLIGYILDTVRPTLAPVESRPLVAVPGGTLTRSSFTCQAAARAAALVQTGE